MKNKKLKNLKNLAEEKYDKVNSIENKEMGMMGFYSNLFTKNKSLGSGFRGETDDTMIKMYHDKKSEFNKLIDDKVEEINEKKDLDKIRENKKYKDEKENIINEIKEKSEKLKKNENDGIGVAIENKISRDDKVEDLKRKYLERKRNRDKEQINE